MTVEKIQLDMENNRNADLGFGKFYNLLPDSGLQKPLLNHIASLQNVNTSKSP